MQKPELNRESDFMIEKIKERPLNKKKLLRRTVTTALMAAIFGLIACLTFILLEPIISNWLHPEEPPAAVVIPDETEEILPEDMLVEDETHITVPDSANLEDEQLDRILAGVELNVDDYREIYDSMSEYVTEINKSVVMVTGAVSNVDWFHEAYESEGFSSGVIFYNNGKEFLILLDRTPISKAETVTVTFFEGTEVEATVKQYDSNTNLVVVAVSLSDVPNDLESKIVVAPLGISSIKNLPGTPIVILGSPMGVPGSVCQGIITSSNTVLGMADANYKLLQTDVFGSQNSSGIIFDLKGQVLGIVTNGKTSSDMKNLVTAYGISELKKMITKLGNGEEPAYMGVVGTDVTTAANEDIGVPLGAYVKEIYMNSPAMRTGIKRGDVITEINGTPIESYMDYVNAILLLKPDDSITVKVMRQTQNEYKEMSFEVTLESAK